MKQWIGVGLVAAFSAGQLFFLYRYLKKKEEKDRLMLDSLQNSLSSMSASTLKKNIKSLDSIDVAPSQIMPQVSNDSFVRRASDAEAPPVYRIVLAGGPCAGKSTALSVVSSRLTAMYEFGFDVIAADLCTRGYKIYLVPEAATLLMTGGVAPGEMNDDQIIRFQADLMKVQMALEDAFSDIARSMRKPAVVLCDRGVMDCQAYMKPDHWQALLDEMGWTVVGLRDRRYDAVIHMVTAAEGAEEFYSSENNKTRYEDPEGARAVDKRIQEGWVGHPHLRIIDNSTDFDGKLHRVMQSVSHLIGAPAHKEVRRKYYVEEWPDSIPLRYEEFEILQTYLLTNDGSEARVRRRGQRKSYRYTFFHRKPADKGKKSVLLSRPISAREYVSLLSQADPDREDVKKVRRCFVWKSQYFQLEKMIEPHEYGQRLVYDILSDFKFARGLTVLEIEVDEKDHEVKLPPFLKIRKEITTDSEFSSYNLARKNIAKPSG